MAENKKDSTGKLGEDAATDFLMRKGYKIIIRNFCTRYGEIDIIAQSCDYIVFAEVKTRARRSMLLPREAVDAKKQSRIIKATKMYLTNHDIGCLQPRFDVIEVMTRGGAVFEVESINHIENAFTV